MCTFFRTIVESESCRFSLYCKVANSSRPLIVAVPLVTYFNLLSKIGPKKYRKLIVAAATISDFTVFRAICGHKNVEKENLLIETIFSSLVYKLFHFVFSCGSPTISLHFFRCKCIVQGWYYRAVGCKHNWGFMTIFIFFDMTFEVIKNGKEPNISINVQILSRPPNNIFFIHE